MRFPVFFLMVILWVALPDHVEAQRLSDRARISVITCGPYQGELYSAFGHSAIRVYDPAQDLDIAFNYGVFNFNQPNFYLNFAKGYLYYKLGVFDYPSFRDFYITNNRYVHEQVLNLNAYQREKLFDFLTWNAQPENQDYVYDYFKNNCATKIREVVERSLGDSVKFDFTYITTDYSIRQLTDLYLKEQPWGDFGIDLCLGSPIDQQAKPEEYLFLPDYIESSFSHATLGNQPLVAGETIEVYKPVAEETTFNWNTPITIFSLVAMVLLVFTVRDYLRRKPTLWIDYLLMGVTGLIGVILLLLWIATDHEPAAWNYNLLWAIPANLAIPFLNRKRWISFYYLGVAILAGILLVFWLVLPQQLNVGILPLLGIIGIRGLFRFTIR